MSLYLGRKTIYTSFYKRMLESHRSHMLTYFANEVVYKSSETYFAFYSTWRGYVSSKPSLLWSRSIQIT